MLMNGNGRNLYLSVNRGAELQIRNSGKDWNRIIAAFYGPWPCFQISNYLLKRNLKLL